jgi:SAM-dependent methyltransferase
VATRLRFSVMTAREFFARASASAGYRLTRLSSSLQATSASADGTSPGQRTLAGDREVEYAWTLAHVTRDAGRVLDFGSGPGITALCAAFAGNDVVAVDLEDEQYLFSGHDIEYIRGDFNRLEWEPGSFDQIINCSSVEHVGLSGRYGSPDDPEGDLRAMDTMAGLLKPGGNMVLTLPVGCDGVYAPWHRVYGEDRLARLLASWAVQQESYWAKPGGAKYEPVSREHALAEQGSATYYALGLYVVTPH